MSFMQQLQAAIAELGRPLLVGSSLGGYYSTFLAEQHGLDALLRAGAYTLAALAGLWVVLRGFGWAVQRLRIGVRWAERRQLLSLRIQKAEILPADRVARALDGAIRVLRLGGLLIIFYLFTSLVLSFFPGTRGLSGTVIGWVLDPLRNLAYGIVRFLPDLFVIIITIMIIIVWQ